MLSPVATSPKPDHSPTSPRGPTPDAGDGSRAAARQRKRRDLLKQYYGIGGESAPQATIKKEKPPDPLDIDNHAFNAELHLNKLMNEMALPDLIQRDNELVAEIKQLDGDMKTLVYENYSKFISATDTIRKMKTNVENMESEMDQLSKSIAKISDSSTTINNGLQDQRAKLHQLNGVDNLLKKLNFVIELPNRLHECVDKGQHAQAVRYYSRVSNLLERYRHMSVFSKIEEECRTIIDKVARLIKQKLNSDQSTLAEISECVGLLIGLNAMFPVELARAYLRAATAQLKQIKINCLKHMNNIQISDAKPASELSGEPLPSDVQLAMEKIQYFDNTYVRDFASFVECYYTFFLTSKENASSPDTKTGDLRPNAFAKMSPEQQEEVRSALVATVESITKDYIDVIERLLHIPDDITKISPLSYIHVLDRVHKDVQDMEPLKRVGKVDRRINAMSFELLSKVITAVFGKIKKEFFNRYKDIQQSKDLDLAVFIKDLNAWMKNTLINQYLPILERFISPNIDFMKHSVFGTDDILDQIQRGLDVFWLSFTEDMIAINNPPKGSNDPVPPPLTTLMMSRSALELSLGTVEGVMSAYTDVLFSRKGDAADAQISTQSMRRPQLMVVTASGGTVAGAAGPGYANRGGNRSQASGTSHETMARAREISGICKTAAQRLVRLYVERIAQDLTLVVQNHLQTTPWLKLTTANGASDAWIAVLDRMSAMEHDVDQLYQDDGSFARRDRGPGRSAEATRANSRPSTAGHSRTGSTSHSYMRNSSSTSSFKSAAGLNKPSAKFDPLLSHIDKLFAERVEYYGQVELSKSAILTAISKLVVKCYMEELRLVTLGTTGFQQIQIDIEVLKVHMWRYCTDERLFNNLVDEIQSCAFRRCLDPQPLEYAVVEPIVNGYERKR
ncbi:uncharacterized protein SPPG_06846 [Spizellomyces punctatus DAOM BR117]|uniref:Vacuolar protein sorting-associated protein 51 homolog n=1 Tax=Spizellomyces punctatus (strain DAOM BR117) TaxID=645134 RepID=A0A0L0H8J1_SPIPD|nr:uncharacterized protein SPPG_06846 [Spizellomyces punctatus DAOM BR117]KNC97850.1 hypothetical protein SPPG_06846 [Spizellomyces punctatus DAOM BR117]|eukprot:XP_016605890.1 hypothetical protein SPPG_06846 [Spizellomyces punctatus DAOM BR117]